MSAFNSPMRQNTYYRNVKWNFEDLWPRYCYAITNYRTTARKFRNLPLQATERSWVKCDLIVAWHQNSEPGFCAVQAACELFLQKSNQLFGSKRLTSGLLETLVLCPNFHGRQIPVLPLLVARQVQQAMQRDLATHQEAFSPPRRFPSAAYGSPPVHAVDVRPLPVDARSRRRRAPPWSETSAEQQTAKYLNLKSVFFLYSKSRIFR